MTTQPSFTQLLEQAVNSMSRENASNTPDYVLAEFMLDALKAFEYATMRREDWYGKRLVPGGMRTYATEECGAKNHSFELWMYDPNAPYCELRCVNCGHEQWFVKSPPPEGWTPEPRLTGAQV